MSSIFMITNTSSAVLANGTIPLTTIARRKGCAIQAGNNSVVLTKAGYYKLSGTVTFTTPTAGDAVIQVLKNGVIVPGIVASITTTTTTNNRTLALTGIIRVFCNEGNANISVLNAGTAINTSNVALDIEYLG